MAGPWLKKVKELLLNTPDEEALPWIPSHCDIPSNEKADVLALEGAELNQFFCLHKGHANGSYHINTVSIQEKAHDV